MPRNGVSMALVHTAHTILTLNIRNQLKYASFYSLPFPVTTSLYTSIIIVGHYSFQEQDAGLLNKTVLLLVLACVGMSQQKLVYSVVGYTSELANYFDHVRLILNCFECRNIVNDAV